MTKQEAIDWLKAISATQKESIHKISLSQRKEALHMAIEALETIQEMEKRNIGTETILEYAKFEDECVKKGFTFRSLLEAREKQIPKKPFQPFGTHSFKCSNCWKFVAHEVSDNCDKENELAGWCPFCGQKLDWKVE